jgi:PhzF family phenazine biosynthesis protein
MSSHAPHATREVPFKQVDVFTAHRYQGNPVAVILDATGMDSLQMQQIANWTNLSETTFVLPPQDPAANYRVRIFTPQDELPFAGHPTLGTAHALLESGLIQASSGRLVQECAAGLIELAVSPSPGGSPEIAFQLPTAKFTLLDASQIDALEAIFGAAIERSFPVTLTDVGPRWTIAQLKNAEAVLAVQPDFASMAKFDLALGASGVTLFGPHQPGHSATYEVRSFAPSHGVNEDPVCGSGNGSVAAALLHHGRTGSHSSGYTATQGIKVGRAGHITVQYTPNGSIHIGGQSVTCVEGVIRI